MKTEKRNVLRACILTMLLAMPVAGSYASSTLWTEGEEISDEYTLPPWRYGVTVDKNDEKVKATGDVIINNNDPSDSWPIIGASGQGNKSFTLDMDGHSLTTGDRGFFINFSGGNDNKVAITNADNIVSNFHKVSAIFSWGEGHTISLDAKNNIELNKVENNNEYSPLFIKDKGSVLSLTAGKDVVVTNGSMSFIIELKKEGRANIHADHDVILNQEYGQNPDFGKNQMIHSENQSQVSISADNDIRFNNKGVNRVVFGKEKGEVNFKAGNDIIYNNQKENANPVHVLESGSKASIKAGHDIILKDVPSVKMFDLKEGSSVTVGAGNDISVSTKSGQAVSLIDTDESSTADITAGHDMTLDIGVAAPVVHAKGTVNLKAGNDMHLSTAGADSMALQIANLYADGGKADITTEATGTLTISNKGAVGAYADNGGNITLGGKVVMNTADGAVVTEGGKITFNGPSLTLKSSTVGLTADDGNITLEGTADIDAVDGAIAQNGGTILFNGPLTLTSTATGLTADEGGITLDGAAVLTAADGAIAENGGTILFNGPLTIHSTATGLMADGSNITIGGEAALDGADGAVAQNGGTILFNGPLTLTGTATGLMADGSTITVGGEAALTGADGAVAQNGGTILFNGPLTLTSSAAGLTADGSNITVDGEAALDTADGAVAENEGTILFNGPLTIRSSGTALQAVDGGVIDASAADAGKYIDGHIVADGGTISLELNKAGSYLTGATTVSGGSDGSPDLNRAASYRIRAAADDSTDGTLDLTLQNGTVWNVTGDSSLTSLTNNGTVNMKDSSRTGQQLTVNTLSGEGTLAMDLDWLSNQGTKGATANSDYVTVTDSATGTQHVVADSSAMNLDKMTVNDRLYIASLHNSDAVLTSSIQGRIAHKGHLYDPVIGLTHETTDDITDWYFTAVDKAESNVVPAADVQNRALFDLATNMDTLNKRLGEARYADGENSGMWARWNYRHLGRDSYDGHGNRFELGYDAPVNGDDGDLLRQGLSFSYLNSRTSFDEGNGKYKGYTGSLYRTWFGQNGHYLDVVGRIGKINGEGTTRLFDGDESKSSFGTWYQQASVEWGRKKVLNDAWYIEPQSQLQYTHINGHDFRTNDGVGQDFDSVHSFIGRLGFRLGRDIDANKAWYFKADILHEFAGNRTFNLTSVDGSERLRFDKTDHDTWYDIGAGITAELSNDRSLWLEFERNFNGSYDNEWELNAGMTWRFH
ncbi:autotransporter outer membrane beta-barrel domain-containing protein [uncultured Megasphaera sp.]|uniref:autotransporter outer membrane beta-barrel domain-containing protein n=1 Tax=uncultured Megasphaera sp. TaxID=165188 RepID=UPI0025EDC757|nr:autotransporter outer membrane beta-barrel domain-containing protein [uncultured Megasphaera sp.]